MTSLVDQLLEIQVQYAQGGFTPAETALHRLITDLPAELIRGGEADIRRTIEGFCVLKQRTNLECVLQQRIVTLPPTGLLPSAARPTRPAPRSAHLPVGYFLPRYRR